MEKFDKELNFAEIDSVEIYSNFKASKAEKTSMDVNANSDLVDTPATSQMEKSTTMKASKIFNFDIDKIYEPYVENIQNRIVH